MCYAKNGFVWLHNVEYIKQKIIHSHVSSASNKDGIEFWHRWWSGLFILNIFVDCIKVGHCKVDRFGVQSSNSIELASICKCFGFAYTFRWVTTLGTQMVIVSSCYAHTMEGTFYFSVCFFMMIFLTQHFYTTRVALLHSQFEFNFKIWFWNNVITTPHYRLMHQYLCQMWQIFPFRTKMINSNNWKCWSFVCLLRYREEMLWRKLIYTIASGRKNENVNAIFRILEIET